MNWTTLFKKFTNGKYIIGLLTVVFLSIGSFTNAFDKIQTFNCDSSSFCSYRATRGNYSNDDLLGIERIGLEGNEITYNYITVRTTQTNTEYLYKVGDKLNVTSIYEFGTFGKGSYTFKFIYKDPPIINGTTSNFTPIITKLGNIVKEFIPYMIYIAIACLGIRLAYKALKYIIGYLQNKSKGAIRGK